LSKTFANSINIVSTLAYIIVIAKLLVAIIFNLTKSFAKQLLLNKIIIYNFKNNVVYILRKIVKFFFTF
jgi:hypothetical protein